MKRHITLILFLAVLSSSLGGGIRGGEKHFPQLIPQNTHSSILEDSREESIACYTCHFILDSMRKTLESSLVYDAIKVTVKSLCRIMYDHEFCDMTEENLIKPMLKNFVDRILHSEVACSKIGFCKYPRIVPDKDQDFIHRVLKDKPPVDRPRVNPNPKILRFAVFTDVHVDYLYKEGAEVNCGYPICCREKNGLGYTEYDKEPILEKGVKAGKWGTVAKCDIPPWTLYNFINFTTEELKPDFFIWLGDNTGHNVWADNEKEHMIPTKDITARFMKKYPAKGQMYPVIGNHEGLPCDEFDLYHNKHQWILDNVTDIWKDWLTEESRETLRKIGCYSQLHPRTTLRIIALFPLAGDLMNPYLWRNSTNPWNILGWFEEELAKSEKNHESVLVLNHFSSNTFFMNNRISLCANPKIEWGLRYRILIDRYTNIIRGILSGHTHEDSFQVLKSEVGKDLAGVIHVNPALTTYPKVNPSFRVYEMDAETFTLLDYVQYRLYLDEANKKGVAEWKEAYRFTELFKVPNLDYYNFPIIVDKLHHDPALFKTFMDMFWAEGPRGPALMKKPEKALKFATCRSLSSDLYEYNNCTGTDFISLEYVFGYGVLSKYLDPKWEYAYYP